MLLLPALVLWACHKPDPTDTDTASLAPPEVTPAECPQEIPGATCGQIELPEADDPERTLTLSTAVLPATGGDEGVPLVLFTGGPGADVFDLAPLFSGAYSALNERRDLVLLSERGTYGATPFLGCPELADVDLAFTLSAEERAAVELDATARCRERLLGEGVDLGAYNNVRRAADVPTVLTALGYTRWHLWGVSGGAMLVQILVRDHPDGIATAMIDSGGFPTAHMRPVMEELLTNADTRFTRLFAACEADPGCASSYPAWEERLMTLYADLEAAPRPVTLTHPVTGETAEIGLDGDLLLQAFVANTNSAAYLPYVTAAAEAGDTSLIEGVLPSLFVADAAENSAAGLYLSVFCADLGPTAAARRDGVRPELAQALGGAVDGLRARCDLWDVPALEPGSLVASDTIPLLDMEGMFDTNRDPDAGAEVTARFSTAWLAEYGDRGHVVLDGCAAEMMEAFMEDPTVSPDMSCVPTEVDWVR